MRGLRERPELWRASLAALLSGFCALLVLRSWRGALDVPYSYSSDGNLHLGFVKTLLDHGWYWHNPNLGAPEGQQLFDYPVLNGDTLNVLLLKLLGAFGLEPATAVNVFFLLTFFLVGLSAYLVLRRLTVSWPVALVCSALFALLPYHFRRAENHLLLSAYYAVPVGAYLVLMVLGGEPLFASRRSKLVTLGLCALVALASGSFYYAAFTVVLVGSAALLRAVADRNLRPLAEGGVVVGAILVLSLAALAPTLAYRARHGTNQQVAQREAFESELYGLKPAQLVLPDRDHRIGKLASLRRRYDAWSPPTEATFSATLGVVATVGLLWLLAISVLQLVSPGRRVASALEGQAGTAVLVALFFAWTGGLATLLAEVYPQIRAWNRLSIFIGFFALLGVALLLDRLRRGWLTAVVLGLVLVIGILDQTSAATIPPYRTLAAEWRNDEAFVHAIDARLPEGAMVFQLPYVPFPENPPVNEMIDYDELRGYLHSDDLRWSYGAVKGRDDPNAALAAEPVPALVRDAAAAGFAGIYVDRFGYTDKAAALEGELAAATGTKPFVSENGRLSFFQLP